MVLYPPCKINLGLNVINKRYDGYHNIETVFYPVSLTDILEAVVAPDGRFSFTYSGLAIAGKPEDNLCSKALQKLNEVYRIPAVKMHLHKVIPMGAGLGGGSSDGTFTLKLLNQLLNLDIPEQELRPMALGLGSDCPYFVDPVPSFASGRGEILEPINVHLDDYQIILVIPGIHVPTVAAYSNVSPGHPEWSLRNLPGLPVSQWRSMVKNDFEKSVFVQFPELAEIKEKLYDDGAVFASMSGSGSTIFGIYEKQAKIGFEWKNAKIVSVK